MVRVDHGCRVGDQRAREAPQLVWFAIAVAAALLISLVIAAANSSGFDRLLPNSEPFIPYFTT